MNKRKTDKNGRRLRLKRKRKRETSLYLNLRNGLRLITMLTKSFLRNLLSASTPLVRTDNLPMNRKGLHSRPQIGSASSGSPSRRPKSNKISIYESMSTMLIEIGSVSMVSASKRKKRKPVTKGAMNAKKSLKMMTKSVL